MRTPADFFDLARHRNDFSSDNQLAKAMGCSRQLIYFMRSGEKPISERMSERLAPLCGVNALQIYAETQVHRAEIDTRQGADERLTFWKKAVDVASRAAAIVLVLGALAPQEGQAYVAHPDRVKSASIYIMSSRRRWWGRQIRRALAALAPPETLAAAVS